MVDFCLQAWESISIDIVKNSFISTGIIKELDENSTLFKRVESQTGFHEELVEAIENTEKNYMSMRDDKDKIVDYLPKKRESLQIESGVKQREKQSKIDSFIEIKKIKIK